MIKTHFQSIKIFIVSSLLLVTASCDINNVLKDDEGIEIPLVIADLNFLDTKINLELVDVETGLPIDERLNITVYANKPIINLKGKLTNEFTVNDGTLTFSVDPNQNISDADPLQLKIEATNNSLLSANSEVEIYDKGDHFISLVIYRQQEIEDLLEDLFDELLFKPNTSEYDVYADGVAIQNGNLPIVSSQGNELLLNYENNKYTSSGTSLTSYFPSLDREAATQTNSVYYGFNKIASTSSYNASIASDVAVTLQPNQAVIQNEYVLIVSYTVSSGSTIQDYTLALDSDGQINQYLSQYSTNYDYSYTESSLGTGTEIIIPQGAKLNYIGLGERSLDYAVCLAGSTVTLNMPDGADGATAKFKLFNNGALKVSQTVAISEGVNTFSTGEFSFDQNYPNILVIEDTAQFDFEPNEIELEGCSQNYNSTATTPSTLKKYNLSARFTCSGEVIAVMPTVLGRIKQQDAPESAWEYFTFESGSASLFLTPDTTYSIKGDFDEKEFFFEFTSSFNEAIIDQLITDLKADNPSLDTITYEYTEVSSSEVDIDINVSFAEGECVFN